MFAWNAIVNETTPSPSTENGLPKSDNPSQPPHALDPLLAIAKQALANHSKEHRDYTAKLIKRERIGDKLYPESVMALKLMYRADTEPSGANGDANPDSDTNADVAARKVSVYLRGLEPKSQEGREVIWVEGKNDNKMTAHEAGILGMLTVELAPNSRLAMIGNRYSITEIGLEKLLRKLIERGERDRQLGPATVRVTEDVMLGKQKCKLFEIIHESPTAIVDGKKVEFEFNVAKIYIDEANQVPIRYVSYAWPKTEGGELELLEDYVYEDLSFNVGLTDEDFSPKNPNYRF